MHLGYGHAQITVDGQAHKLVPSLVNISKVGDPKQIIDTVKALYTDRYTTDSFLCAVQLLMACGLPQYITGGWSYSKRQNRILIRLGRLPLKDVYTLAYHVVKHGISGLSKDKTGEPMREFNPHQFITLAMDYFKLSLAEAENLTMSQLVLLLESKQKKPDQPDENEIDDMMAWYEAKAKALNIRHGVH